MKRLALPLSFLAAACGSPSPSEPDAAPAPAPDAASSAITVDGLLVGDVVLFYDPAGALLSRTTIVRSDQFSVTGAAPSGGAVTIARTGSSEMSTFVAVEPGDHLHMGYGAAEDYGNVDEVAFVLPPLPNAVSYSVYGRYAFGGAPASGSPTHVPGYRTLGAASDSLFVVAYPEPGDAQYFEADGVALAKTIDLSGYTWRSLSATTDFTLTAGGVPWIQGDGTMTLFAGPHRIPSYWADTISDGAVTIVGADRGNFDVLASFDVEIAATKGGAPFEKATVSYANPSTSIDLEDVTLPAVTDVTLSPAGDVTWKAAGGVIAPVAIALEVSPAVKGSWIVIAPPGDQAFRLPPLPADLQWPGGLSGIKAEFIGSDDGGGYAALRNDPLARSPEMFAFERPRDGHGYHVVRWY